MRPLPGLHSVSVQDCQRKSCVWYSPTAAPSDLHSRPEKMEDPCETWSRRLIVISRLSRRVEGVPTRKSHSELAVSFPGFSAIDHDHHAFDPDKT